MQTINITTEALTFYTQYYFIAGFLSGVVVTFIVLGLIRIFR